MAEFDLFSTPENSISDFGAPQQGGQVFPMFNASLPVIIAAGGVTYRMRANDTTLGYPIYWESSTIDALGANYAGPGPLTDVVVAEVIGLP